tara:strand:- start:5576 stop:5806 length:231 start_codon:yes stop_codon:yes gene_type:complete
MNIEEQINLNHLLLNDRKCRSCGEMKNLLTDFYRTRKNRTTASSYSYECKDCTKIRIKKSRKKIKDQRIKDVYPDW